LAQEIAEKNGLDGERAHLAALLHDAARDLPEEELLSLAPPENEVERAHPLSLHGRAARRLAEGWGVEDEEVLEAIEGHVYGVDPQNGIGMALYIADIAEPGRGVNGEIRELALAGRLSEAYRLAVANKVNYLQARRASPSTPGPWRSTRPFWPMRPRLSFLLSRSGPLRPRERPLPGPGAPREEGLRPRRLGALPEVGVVVAARDVEYCGHHTPCGPGSRTDTIFYLRLVGGEVKGVAIPRDLYSPSGRGQDQRRLRPGWAPSF
jgi:predicted HD superfamily hydrolase involved in NAD metabolism